MATKWHFAKFTAETIKETCDAWTKEASKSGSFPGEVEQILAWAKANTEHVDGKSCAYGVFLQGDTCASGICEVVVSKRGNRSGWVKHLRLRLRPQLDDKLFALETSAVTTAVEIFGQSTVGALALKSEHGATTLKVYARTKEQLVFLQMAATALKTVAKRHTIDIEGRFLVIANLPKD